MMGIVHQQFPGHTFRRSTGVDEHHDHVRYGWELLDGAGRLVHVAGFFGPLPELV
jgi:hypothetical protein